MLTCTSLSDIRGRVSQLTLTHKGSVSVLTETHQAQVMTELALVNILKHTRFQASFRKILSLEGNLSLLITGNHPVFSILLSAWI